MLGSSSYRSDTDIFGLLSLSGGIWISLTFVAFIAAIVCTVLIYKKYVSEDKVNPKAGLKHDFGPFIRFEKFWSEKILIVLFVYNMCFIAFGSAAAAISLLSTIAYSAVGAFFGIIFVIVVFVLGEVSNRLFYEFFMLIVKMWRNTQDIRTTLAKDVPMQASASNGGSFQPVSSNVNSVNTVHPKNIRTDLSSTNPIPPVKHASFQAETSSDLAWTCDSCGAKNKAGSFCSQCGKHRS